MELMSALSDLPLAVNGEDCGAATAVRYIIASIMWDTIESFFAAHQHTVEAIGAFSTLGAVIVSLILALFAHRRSLTRLRATASISRITHSSLSGQERRRYFTVAVRNVGSFPARLPLTYFRWKLPFADAVWFITPWTLLATINGSRSVVIPQKFRSGDLKRFF
jgi:hypothetical protein